MSTRYSFEHSISISASASQVEQCLTRQDLMHRWLNPALRCDPIGDWSTELGAKSRFVIQVPLWQPALVSTVVERQPGLIVWAFAGFFNGRDRWECTPEPAGTRLLNQFEFEIPNPVVQAGFKWFAASLTQRDMAAQLRRLKQVAETQINQC
ncbi:SRPBCC family protein [Phormidium tenue]|uniref:Polyketide cyclase n=1 Tax=Phormidium tenue NIES-30 TaxID=549789 RepID=A0A1U7J2M4_9CYAN|nr:SRPBCC family protein [Phormidium tenue]MBD2231865.1 SRPBCC family protein [Phormidium tenue FACHB-1052]OKH46422.1 polyketide cyclase [Phormidium tenue NIES-30]